MENQPSFLKTILMVVEVLKSIIMLIILASILITGVYLALFKPEEVRAYLEGMLQLL